jgi:hypothetical protein
LSNRLLNHVIWIACHVHRDAKYDLRKLQTGCLYCFRTRVDMRCYLLPGVVKRLALTPRLTLARFGAAILAVTALTLAWHFTPLSKFIGPSSLADALETLSESPLVPVFVMSGFAVGGLIAFPLVVMIAATAAAFGPLLGFTYALQIDKANRTAPVRSARKVVPRAKAPDSGLASFYWQPQRVSAGGTFDPRAMTAAHRSLPFGTRVRVTHARNVGRWM